MIRRKRLSLLGTLASATSILSATSASAILSIAGASLLLAAAVPAQAQNAVTAPTMDIGVTSPTQTATVKITTAGTLNSISVLTQGATGLDYVVVAGGTCATGTTYAVNDTCTVKFSFTPTHPWARYGGISLFDASNNLLGNIFLNGVGTGPQVSYPLSAASTATAFGSGASNPFGVAVDGSGNIYVTDPGHGKLYELIAVNGVVPTTNPTIITLGSGFSSPWGVAVDGSGNVYVADVGLSAVKELVAVGGAVPATNPTIVPLATGYMFMSPNGVAVDSSGNVYVADAGNGDVIELKATDGVIPSTVTPTVLNGPFNSFPAGVAVDASGNVYVAYANLNQVKKFAAVNGTVNPTPTTLPGSFPQVSGVAVDGSGDLYVVYGVGVGNVEEIVVGSGATIPLGSGFTEFGQVAVDASGNVYVTDTESGHSLVKELNAQNPPPLTFASTAVGATSSDSPQTLTVANNGNAPLLFAVPTTGSNPSVATNFSLSSSSTCPQLTSTASSPGSLAAGASCTDVLSFEPTQAGNLTGSLTTTDNAAGSPRSVSLSGTGTAAPTSVSVTGALTVYASNAMITATVTANGSGTINPNGPADGSVTFTVVNGSTVATPQTVPLSGGTASYSIAKVLPGNYTITAAYSGSSNFLSQTKTVVITPSAAVAPTVVPALASGSTATVNGSTTFQATITSSASTAPSGGTVTFMADTTTLPCATPAVLTSGSSTVSCVVSPLLVPAGPHTLTAKYSNDPAFSDGTGSTSFTVASATPTVTVTANLASTTVNQPVTFTATASALAGGIQPTGGTFVFKAGGTPIAGCPTAAGSTTATCTTTALTASSYTITANYSTTDINFAAGNTGTLSSPFTVSPGATNATLTASPGTATEVNQAVTYTATITQSTPTTGPVPTGTIKPTGTVTFYNALGGTSPTPISAACTNVAISGGVYTCSTASLPLNTTSSPSTPITAIYTSGDTNFTGSNSAALNQTITQDQSTIAVALGTGATGTTSVDQAATFTATITPAYVGGKTPVGESVAFFYAGTAIPCTSTPTIASSGTPAVYTASCTTYSLPASGVQGYGITAAYNGDTYIAAAKSTGNPVIQVVNPSSYTVAVTTSEPTIVANQTTQPTYTATVTAGGSPLSGGVPLTGAVTFIVSGGDGTVTTTTCSAPPTVQTGPVTTLVATCPVSFPSNQSNSAFQVTATYSKDTNFSKLVAPTAPAVNPVTQVVQDFIITAPATNATAVPTGATAPTAVFVTQGYTIGSGSSNPDPFFSAVTVGAKAFDTFADTVSFGATCTAAATNPTTQTTPPACTPPTSAVIPSGGFPITFSTSAGTSAGDYTVALTGTDSNVSSLSHKATFTLTVVPIAVNPQVSNQATENANAQFTVPAASAGHTFTFGCSQAFASGKLLTTGTSGDFYCNPVVSSGTLPANGFASFTVVNPATTAENRTRPEHSSISFAFTIFGLPFLALAGFAGRKHLGAQGRLRLLGLIVLMVGLAQIMGCGSNGFTPPTSSSGSSSALSPGNYLVQVDAKDNSTGATYYSVIQVKVAAQ